MGKMRIAVVGLGGVGGFYGGLLAHRYRNFEEVEICFVVRGKHLEVVQSEGIRVTSKGETLVGIPDRATNHPEELGILDCMILCTKNYDLEAVIDQVRPCVRQGTVLIPLLNGVQAYEQLQKSFPEAVVCMGCTYMVSRLTEAGVIENPSGRQKIYFGCPEANDWQMKSIENLLREAGINASLSRVITEEVWEKYILVSSSATATSYFNCSIGTVMTTHPEEIEKLVSEATAVARAKDIALSVEVQNKVLARLRAIPFESTTSMHSDFLTGAHRTELEVMTGYIIQEAERYSVPVPEYRRMYAVLKKGKGKNVRYQD